MNAQLDDVRGLRRESAKASKKKNDEEGNGD